jgi:hypothetical protein
LIFGFGLAEFQGAFSFWQPIAIRHQHTHATSLSLSAHPVMGWKKDATEAVLTNAMVIVTLERDLLLSSLSRPVGSQPPISGPSAVPAKAGVRARAAAEVVALVRKGNYDAALASPAARSLLLGVGVGTEGAADAVGAVAGAVAIAAEGTPEAAAAHFAAVEAAIAAAAATATAAGGTEPAAHELCVLAVGVAALSAFTQANVTGPDLRNAPACPTGVSIPAAAAAGTVVGSASNVADASKNVSVEATEAWNKWATAQLSLDGEDLVGRCFLPQYLYLARLLLVGLAPFPTTLFCSRSTS